jgi:hypothetical protein
VTHAGWRRRLLPAALATVLLAAALLTGCSGQPVAPADTATDFRPAPEVPPIERLGRWDGTAFLPVTPGSVTGGDVYVLVHGWAAGYRAAVERWRGPGPLLAWSPAAVDAQGERMFTSFFPLAAAITKDDPGATVLGFSWIDDSATAYSPFQAWRSEARTDLNGQRLAAALGQLLAPGFAASGGRIQLIGHSHGAKVATVAAIALERPPAQLTLLDSPDDVLARLPGAANHLEGYLPLLPVGTDPGDTFVDSYFSIAGERYGTFPALERVVDVQLEPAQYPLASIAGLIDRHAYPIAWYAKSADDLAADVGFAWSPLVGHPPDCLACFFRQDWTTPAGRVIPADELRLERVGLTERRARVRRRLEVQPLRGPITAIRPDGVVLRSRGERLWQVEFDRAVDDLAIEFDDRFTAPAGGAQLALWLDGRQVFTSAADWAGATGHHAVVDVSTLDPGSHRLTAVVTPGRGGRDARVILGGFEVVAQPGTAPPAAPLSWQAKLALLGLVLFAIVAVLAWFLRRDEQQASGAPTRREARAEASAG